MSPSKWTAEHGNLLKSLRQKAGLDIATLARKHILSTTQIGQLEGGGDSAFYNAEIKFSSGKKLLHALGHDLPELVLAKNPPQIESSSSLLVNRPTGPRFRLTPKNLAWPLLLLLVAMGLLGWYLDSDQKIKVTEQVRFENSAPTQLPASVEPVVVTPPADLDRSTKTPTTKEQAQLTPPSAMCNWQSSETEVQPSFPRKPGDYVHLVAQQDVVVCIKDSEQRLAILELQSGHARSIYGTAPFKVYSANLSQLKIYFQGQSIKLSSEDIQQLRLSSASL